MKKILVGVLLVAMLLCMFACGKPEKSILGTWKAQNSVLGVVTETVYTFKEDGTGTKSGILTTDFTYAFVDEKLVITTSTLGIKSTDEYTYKFDGDTLLLTKDEETVKLVKEG